MPLRCPRPALLAICFFLALPCAHALDRVTLSNGFSYDCAGRQPVDAAHTRLFLSTDNGTNYIDVPTAAIVAVDILPPPATPAIAEHAPQPKPAAISIPTLLTLAGTLHNIDTELLASVIHAESSGNLHALSRAGAQGLMQLMPSTARALGVHDSFAPDQNINGGTTYLDALLTRYHDNLALALAAYNAGPAAVDRYHGIPPFRETQLYVARILTEFKHRKEALARRSAPHTLQASR